ncbi:hypothetical protein [Pajaroellobacter abortibovis]|nr:hypothetical protein [Pajaroellobacter abortibovis]
MKRAPGTPFLYQTLYRYEEPTGMQKVEVVRGALLWASSVDEGVG